MKRFPVLQQYDAMDCGPTCLAMISKYYGKNYNIEHLHDLCHISNEGVSLYGISIAAEKIGFHTVGTQLSLIQLIDEMPLPCILHWNQNHFTVLYKIKKTKKGCTFYIANPAGGVRMVFNEWEFSSSWLNGTDEHGQSTGVALSLQPTPLFYEKRGDQKLKRNEKKTLVFLFSYLKPYKRKIILLLSVMVCGATIQLMLPFLTQAIADWGIKGKDINIILLILIGQLSLECGQAIVSFIRSWTLLIIGTKTNIALISDYLMKLMKLRISFFDTKLNGDIIQRINDHSRIQAFLTDSSLDTLFSIVSMIVLGVVILIYNWIVALIFFTGSILYICWVWRFMKRRELLDHKIFSLNSANQSSVIQLISGMQEIKLNVCEQQKRWEWESIQRNIYRLSIRGLKLSQYQQSGGFFLNQVKNLIITALVATLVVKGKITFGMMLSIQYIVGMLNSPVEQLINFFRQYQDAKLSINRLQYVYEEKNEDDETKVGTDSMQDGDIILHHVTFRYDKLSSKPTLNDINLKIPEGKVTAIVGLSGSGKTTILKMILGFYCPDKGSIEIGGVNLESMNKREWRKCCGTVMQEGYIFSDTIKNNITSGIEPSNTELVKKSAKIANINDFIEELPLKYKTRIGNDGHGLSLGQKQRILIARAIYKNPKYILLDEATNSLDANNEHEIMENLNNFIKGRTAIIIAHRLSTVRNADNIVVLKDGKICEQGDHITMISKKGVYYQLVKNQLDI
ncbi:ABC transporter, ATP-binding protein [Prevotella amnii]|uniref:ABC transporter, ATP-binding protein n=1 Tax=Prevotella amnii TaxID=419005 RepID=A0A134BD37_9BACT|nr:peptidase domain-containing ABC transporter [Prevotella amnii]KXB77872.1 ABC transporter, ATP-binding protein [Prevotella amnii]